MALWVVVVCLEDESESVAGRKDGLVARVIPISRVLMATKPSQDLSIIENLKKSYEGQI